MPRTCTRGRDCLVLRLRWRNRPGTSALNTSMSASSLVCSPWWQRPTTESPFIVLYAPTTVCLFRHGLALGRFSRPAPPASGCSTRRSVPLSVSREAPSLNSTMSIALAGIATRSERRKWPLNSPPMRRHRYSGQIRSGLGEGSGSRAGRTMQHELKWCSDRHRLTRCCRRSPTGTLGFLWHWARFLNMERQPM